MIRRNSKGSSGSIASMELISRIKILSMGDGGCGKSCLIKRYCEGKVNFSCIGVYRGAHPNYDTLVR
jgi:GTPase SAR1 family protein